ncbi:plastocyanin [Streptomyces sp. 840.1]|uniref:cupredoxin domain-containing protein n=1 Tax=Streptomyces sp. 840.1 TaxID=2485152 RepID=UPI000F46BE6B|nr:cupredoxin domain-containing protein [Streptomyces sp. 840.1]ROQ70484.1 plastocyanin [Streptomyces sp. 840.1]
MPFSFRTGRARFAVAAAAIALSSTALAGCSDSGGGGGGSSSAPATPPSLIPPTASSPSASASSRPPAGGGTKVSIKNFKFLPAAPTVAPGTKITVTNDDTTTHTMTATKGKAFDTGDIAPGKSATFTAPSKAGAYPYDCTIHPFMTGTLTVK